MYGPDRPFRVGTIYPGYGMSRAPLSAFCCHEMVTTLLTTSLTDVPSPKDHIALDRLWRLLVLKDRS